MWQDLYKNSNAFMEPFHMRTQATFPLSFSDLGDMFTGLRRDKSPIKLNYLRGYVSGREDYALANDFLAKMPDAATVHTNDNPETQTYDQDNDPGDGHYGNCVLEAIKHFFSDTNPTVGSQAGLVVNGGLQWSEAIQSKLLPSVDQIQKLYPNTHFTVDLTFFIGAYGATPFGVHKDDSSHRTILFNLGPGTKGIALWRNQDILREFGPVSNILDPNIIKAQAERYFFEQNAAFVLPSYRYHVGLNSTLSITAAVVIDIVDASKALSRETQQLFADVSVSTSVPTHADTKSTAQTRHSHSSYEALFTLTARDLSQLSELRTESNHYFRYATSPSSLDHTELKPSTRLEKAAHFTSFVHKMPNFEIIYSRGRHLLTPTLFSKCSLGALLATPKLTVSKFISATDGVGVALSDQLRVIKFLIETNLLKSVAT